MDTLENEVNATKALVQQFWRENMVPPNHQLIPPKSIAEKIDQLIAKNGYRKVADAFGIARKQYFLQFHEYTVDPVVFESDELPFDLEDSEWLYQAYCRVSDYWPQLISSRTMQTLKDYENRVRYCYGDFFTLTVKRLKLANAVYNRLWEWDDDIHDHWRPDASDPNYLGPELLESHEYTLTDADLHRMHDACQAKQIEQLIRDLLVLLKREWAEFGRSIKPEFIRAYVLCKTRSIDEEGWGPDVYLLSKNTRNWLLREMAAILGNDEMNRLFTPSDLKLAGLDLGGEVPDKSPEYDDYFLWGDSCRENAFAIMGEDVFQPLYRPELDIENYLLRPWTLEPVDPEGIVPPQSKEDAVSSERKAGDLPF